MWISALAGLWVAATPLSAAGTDFQTRLNERARQLSIPGIAYAVVRDGQVAITGSINTGKDGAIDSGTPLRFASVTKAFTAVLLMRAVEAGKISLDDSVSKWLPEFSDRPEIRVRHLAAHVSEGIPGTEYVYGTARFARLGDILSKAWGTSSYEAALRREVIDPAGLTWHDSPDLGAHAALVSTVSDVARFAAALQTHKLMSKKSFDAMTTPFVSPTGQAQPVGVGFFSQQIGGERVVWSFGQDDPDYGSALLLMIPKRKLALVMLANTDELSNPFRLLMGNIRTSPFATAFLDSFAPDLARDIGPRDREITDMLAMVSNMEAEGVARRFARFAAGHRPRADDFALHFVAGALTAKLPREYCLSLDSKVVGAHPRNRWALLMSGGLQAALGNRELAINRYEALLALPNQEPDGLARLFRAWAFTGMAAAVKDVDAARARRYVEEGLATGVTGGTRDSLLRLKESLVD
jgi:CubicO group peptidase (beta-lactamase class C family)